jgi:hypothetical protein
MGVLPSRYQATLLVVLAFYAGITGTASSDIQGELFSFLQVLQRARSAMITDAVV